MSEHFEDDFIEDELDLDDMYPDDEVPFMEVMPSIEEVSSRVEEMARVYHLNDDAEKELHKLFLCKYRCEDMEERRMQPYYNLLLRTDDPERATMLAEDMRKLCGEIAENETATINESEELTTGKLKPASDNERDVKAWKQHTENLFRTNSCVCVYGCGDAPVIDTDLPTGSERQKNLNQVRMHKLFWDSMAEFAEKNHDCTLLVVMPDRIYKHSFKDNKRMTECVCAHQIFVPEMTMDEVCAECIKKLKGYEIAPGFEEKLRRSLEAEYPVTKLDKQFFLDNVVNNIISCYIIEHGGSGPLTADMIPSVEGGLLTTEEILAKLDEMVGLKELKKKFREMCDAISAGMGEEGLPHIVLKGKPGSGKTTVARLLTDTLFRMGVIKNNRLVETRPSDLVSEWRNGSAKRAHQRFVEAAGGVVFVDEAYDFISDDNEGKKSALQIIMQAIDNDEALVIFAGYKDEMENLMNLNRGLASRIRYTFEFDDYDVKELKEIFYINMKADGFTMDETADSMLDLVIAARRCDENFGNGRDMLTLWKDIKSKWILDVKGDINASRIIGKKHLEDVMPAKTELAINDMVAHESLKKRIGDFEKFAEYEQFMKANGHEMPSSNKHMVFSGNPGTGKTTVAKGMGQDMYNIGFLKTNKCEVVSGTDLASSVCPEETLDKHVNKAKGGILFIDEAYALCDTVQGIRAIGKLLTVMEDHKDDMIIILAGYTDEMRRLLDINPGLESRIGYTFNFEDYTLDELYLIYESKMKKAGYELAEGTEEAVKNLIDYFMDKSHFGNGRFVETVTKETIQKRAVRGYDASDANVILKEDIPTVAEFKDTVMDGESMYDPDELDEERHKRTAVHEVGHALVALDMDDGFVPESISIRSRSSSYGRVKLPKGYCPEMTEQWCKDRVAMLMAGRNAEIMFFGQSSAGCKGDYAKAKDLAGRMVKDYAMGEIGVTKKNDIIREACARCDELLEKYRDFIEMIVDRLMEKKEISGDEMREAFIEYKKQHEDVNR